MVVAVYVIVMHEPIICGVSYTKMCLLCCKFEVWWVTGSPS
jgi:hypothetical protein